MGRRQGNLPLADVPRLALDLKRVISDIKPDLIHAGPIQTCAFLCGFDRIPSALDDVMGLRLDAGC